VRKRKEAKNDYHLRKKQRGSFGLVCFCGRGGGRVSPTPHLLPIHKGGGGKAFQARDKESELMLDYLRLSPMIGGGSLSLKSNGREQPKEKEEENMKCNECEREVEVEDGVALCHYHYNNESLAKPGAFYEVKV
jgi:hypothetical protein